ncbi:hypothetical protein U1Q18_006496, partial [Sarracenia purpurea var. burkii]
DLQSLINKVISHSLNNHVTLSWSDGFVVDAEDQSLPGFLYSDAARALQSGECNNSICKRWQWQNRDFPTLGGSKTCDKKRTIRLYRYNIN